MVALTTSGSAMFGSTWRTRMRSRPDAGDPGRRDVVAGRDAGHEGLDQPGERRRAGQADREHRTGGADAEDDREEQREQEAREGDRDVDCRR